MQSSAASTSAQRPPSSAPVLEYVCLFTRDLKRKQKRWQDGRLKFHTFNKRIMVYDERGNFIGDTHWREDCEFGDGDEVQLERGGVIVQASECVANHSQDLFELIGKRVQEKEQRQSVAAARQSRSIPSGGMPARPSPASSHFQVRHAPLHNLLGTPTGHHGRALAPIESPFEERRRLNAQQSPEQQEESPRPAKRRKRELSPPSKSGYAQSLFGTTLTLSGRPMSSAPIRHLPASQGHRHGDIPPPSSDVSNKNGDDDEKVREISPAAKAKPQGNVPLSERRPAAINTPTAQPDALVGKDARSKANVPSLLQTRPVRPVISAMIGSRKAHQLSDSVGESEPMLMEENTNAISNPNEIRNVGPMKASRLSNSGDLESVPAEETTNTRSAPKKKSAHRSIPVSQCSPKAQPREKALKERSRVRTTKESGTPDATRASASIQQSSTHKDPATRKTLRTPVINLDGPGLYEQLMAEKPAVRESRIELRTAPSKKRRLLVLSEQGNAKKAKKTRKLGTYNDEPGHSRSPLAAINNKDSGSLPKTEVRPLNVSESESGLLKPSADATTSAEPNAFEKANAGAGAGEGLVASTSVQRQTRGALIPLNDNSHDRCEEVKTSGNQTAKKGNACIDIITLSSQDIDEQQLHRNSAHETPMEETLKQLKQQQPDTQRQQPDRQQKDRKQSSTKTQRDDAAVTTTDMQRLEEEMDLDIQTEPYQNLPASPRREKYERDFDEILSRRPKNAPQPRLAKLSRNSIRSREVIGLFYEDNEGPPLLTKPNPHPAQRKSSVTLPGPSVATTSSSKNSGSGDLARADQWAMTEELAQLSKQDSNSSGQRHGVEIQRVKPIIETAEIPRSPLVKPSYPDTQEHPISAASNVRADMESGASSRPMVAFVASKRARSPVHSLSFNGREISAVTQTSKDVSLDPKALPGKVKDKTTPAQLNKGRESQNDGVLTKTNRPDSAQSVENRVPEGDVQKEGISTPATNQKPVSRIVNPASRGKKAAKPSDAAGQAPESVLPSDEQVIGRPANKIVNGPRNELPGFSKANGGAWSKEAHDLFEYQRPG